MSSNGGGWEANRGDRTLQVRLIMHHAPKDFGQLTPGGGMNWGRCRFALNPPPDSPTDYAIVLYNARPLDRFACAPENTLFIAGEPPAKKVYPRQFYRQFHRIVDTHALSAHPRVTVSALGLPWHVGLDLQTGGYRYGYDYLTALACPAKENRISVVCSDAAFTPGQRLRLEFLRAVKQRLGSRLVHYGRGFEPVRDKLEAILPHRLHLVLENSESPHYWTEKLADAYLGWAFPLYVGCPNLDNYFPPATFLRLNPQDPDAAAAHIAALLESPLAPGEQAAIADARNRVLNCYNPFAWCEKFVRQFHQPAPERMINIRSHKAFRSFPRGWLYRLRRQG